MTNLDTLLSKLASVKRRGDEHEARCPVHDDDQASLSVGTNDTGDILLHCHAGCEPAAIVEALGLRWADLFAKPNGQHAPAPKPPRITAPPPLTAPTPKLAHPQHGAPDALHVYRGTNNELLGYVMRFNTKPRKTFCPLTWSQSDGWQMKTWSNPKPLYGLDRLAARCGNAVIVVEGEKAANAAHASAPRNACLTWPGGAGAIKHADWTPLRGLSVILWPDADEPGRKAMAELAALLIAQDCTVRTVLTDDLPDGFDAADLTVPLRTWLTPRLRAYTAPAAPAATTVAPPMPDASPAPAVDLSEAIEAAKTDAGALFEPAVLAAVATLRRDAPADYQRVRAQLKEAGTVSITELDRLTGPKASVTPITEARTLRQEKPAPDADELPARYSHDSLAAAFTAEHPDWRHVGDWGKWLCWNGSYWKADTTGGVLELARQVCRTAGADARSRDIPASTIRDILKVGTIGAVEKIARSDPAHARSVEQWDADPWALNTPGGIVDLHDGSIRHGCPQDHATRITRAVPTPESVCPAWMQFLVDATNGNAELMRYLQRMVGYFLTGSVRDHALFFFHGNGGNGKGTFLRAINWILNDYAWTADADVFIEQKSPQHKTELASFMGRRLVSSEEINEGARWNEARINKLTGGDTITANFMRQDQFAFAPTHKLLIVANNKPMFRQVGDAIRRRLHLIPFTHKIEKPDGKIEDRLRAEANGILRWAVAGCQEWQRIGLDPPELVRLATDGYLSSQDSIATWITESCEVPTEELRRLSPASYWETRTGELFNSYRAWSDSNGEPGLGRKRFTQAMETRGFATREESKRFYVAGIRLRPAENAAG